MKYEALQPFEFTQNGYSARRDKEAEPRCLLMGIAFDTSHIYFHESGDEFIRSASVADAALDNELIAGFEPMDALRIGIEFERGRKVGAYE